MHLRFVTIASIIFTVRNEIAKVMFLQVCVCPRGGVVSQHALQVVSQHALQQDSGGVLFQHALQVVSQHALQQVSREMSVPGESALGRGVPGLGGPGPGGVSAPGGLLPGGLVSQHALRQTPSLGETATAADGTHPTGMHSC